MKDTRLKEEKNEIPFTRRELEAEFRSIKGSVWFIGVVLSSGMNYPIGIVICSFFYFLTVVVDLLDSYIYRKQYKKEQKEGN